MVYHCIRNALWDYKYTTPKFHYRLSCTYALHARIICMYTRCWIALAYKKCLHSSTYNYIWQPETIDSLDIIPKSLDFWYFPWILNFGTKNNMK